MAKRGAAASSPIEVLVGQLFTVLLEPEGSLNDAIRSQRENHYGGVFLGRGNLKSVEQVRRLTFRFRRHAPDIPPPLIATDEEGGVVSIMGHLTTPAPSAAVLGVLDDPEVTRDVYVGVGEKLRALGLNTVFAPVLDVNSDPSNPVIGTRAFGSRPEIVIKHARAALEGLRESGVVPCVKHFPGHGDTSEDSHQTLPEVRADRKTLEERELWPFRETFDESPAPEILMTAHVAYPSLDRSGVPATTSEPILRDLLRKDLGYQGVVVTDSMEMKGITRQLGPEKAAEAAIQAGVDVLLYAQDPGMAKVAYDGVVRAVQSGKISEGRIMHSVDRLFRLREQFRGKPWLTDEEAKEILELTHEQVFFEAALDGVILEGIAGVLGEIPGAPGPKLIVLPRALDPHRPLRIDVVREQLEPAGFSVLEVGAVPSGEEIGLAEGRAAEASVVVVGTISRGAMSEESKKLVAALTRRDVIKIGVALLDPGDADHMMTTNCRIKTFGFSVPHLWALCQKLLG